MGKRLIYLACSVSMLTLAGSTSAGLVAHWKFDGNLADSVGSANGTFAGGTAIYADGKLGNAVSFDGVDDFVNIPSPVSPAIYTIALWVKPARTDAASIVVRTSAMGPTSEWSHQLRINPSGAFHHYLWVGAERNIPGTTTIVPDTWYHVVIVAQNNGPMHLYVNGQEEGVSIDTAGTLWGSGDRIYVGSNSGHSMGWFKGLVDDLRIYDRALSGALVEDLFNGIEPAWVKAEKPSPPDGATGVTSPLLSWTPGETAAFHEVYFGTNPTPGPAEYKGRQTWAVYFQLGLTPSATYYWRVDEVEADGTTIHAGDVWSFTVAPVTAYNPNPPDGSKWAAIDSILSWSAGMNAVRHDVYFGTNQADVASGTGGTLKASAQGQMTYDPGALTANTTYYWRIDETEQSDTKHPGGVWSFRTVPNIPITDPNLVGWWKFDEGEGATALDWSGHGNHGILRNEPQWVFDGYHGGALAFDGQNDYVSVPLDVSETQYGAALWFKTTNGNCGLMAVVDSDLGVGGHDRHIYLTGGNIRIRLWDTEEIETAGLNFADGLWHHVAYTYGATIGGQKLYVDGALRASGTKNASDFDWQKRVNIGFSNDAANSYFQGVLDDVRIYNVALTPAQIKQVIRGDPTLAWNPKPANNAITDIEGALPLTWSPGEKAAQHDVYLGTNQTAVANATTASTGIYRGRQAAANYTPPEGLQWGGGPYYWRIDEYNTDATISAGKVWSFRVADYLIVDDFEDYTDDVGSRIFQTWKDGLGYNEPPPGYGGNGTGSTVGKAVPPFAEQRIVHGGGQSMPLGYDNSGTAGKARYSETFREWASPQDWTRNNVKALTLYFYGALVNAGEQLYVALEDNAGHIKVVNHPDVEAVQKAGWQEWNIELAQFSAAGVNLAAIKKMYIGLGNRTSPKAGGMGTIFVDDIRVYCSRCVPSMGKPAADLSGNCVVDQADVDILANLWLNTGLQVTPVDPGTTGLIAHYLFNGNANDVVGGHNGTASGTPTYTTGKIGQAILLNGVDQMVTVGAVGISGASPRTIAGWAKSNALVAALPDWINIFGFVGPQTDTPDPRTNMSFDIELVNVGGNRGYGIHVYGWERVITPIDFEWHHLAATYDGTTIRWYGDGLLVGSDNTRTLATRDQVHMGKRDDNANYWPGCIDEVRIYNRQLSDAQIAWVAGRTSPFSIPADLRQDGSIDFKDFAVLADSWLEELLWP